MDPARTATKAGTVATARSASSSATSSSSSGDDLIAVAGSGSGETAVARVGVPSTETTPRRSRVEVTRVDLWSVLKVSLCFYLAALAVVIIAGLVAWLLLDASGGIRNFERFMGDIMSADDYRLVASEILLGSALVGLVIVALVTILTVIAAALYNVFTDLVGGVEVTLIEAD